VTEHLLEGKSLEWLLESATDAMIIIDREGRIILANPIIEKLFGYPRQELTGEPMEVLLPERFRHVHHSQRGNYFAQPHARAMGTGMELLGLRQDGSEFPVDVSLSPLKTEQGLLVMATIHDITRRKRAEEALRESEARMRAIFDTAVDGIVTIDERGTIESFNPAAERMFGYTEAEVVEKNVSMLMPSPYHEAHDGYLAHYLQTGEKKIIGIGREVVGLRKDGTTFPMDLAVGETRQGERRMFTGTVRDISERKQAEEQRDRLLRELESANEELKNFGYVVSHDLKAPLRAIGSLADWLSTDYADKFDDEGKEHMRLLISRVRRMDGLIDGILQYSRVGRVKEVAVAVELNQLVREVIDLLAPPENIEVSVENSLPTVMAEPTRIQQVFQNLLSNAIKYMDKPKGEIRITCGAEGRQWKFSITDNGPGIAQQHFEKIFQLFQTLAPRDRVESTGVGLALVKKIVEMYGGRVWLESTVGRGSTFFFTLPRTAATPVSTKGNQPKENSA
jgi:two-component system sensor kinase FixL